MTPHSVADRLLNVALVLAPFLFLWIGAMLLRPGRPPAGWVTVIAAFGLAAVGAAAGWPACLKVCEYVCGYSCSGNGFVAFAFRWQNEITPYITFRDGGKAAAVAESLNFRLGMLGSVAGAIVGLAGGGVLIWIARCCLPMAAQPDDAAGSSSTADGYVPSGVAQRTSSGGC